MKPVVGVFKSRPAAQRAAAKLVPLGIPKDRINILTPDVTHPGTHEREPFRRGYKRGRAYFEALRKNATTSKR